MNLRSNFALLLAVLLASCTPSDGNNETGSTNTANNETSNTSDNAEPGVATLIVSIRNDSTNDCPVTEANLIATESDDPNRLTIQTDADPPYFQLNYLQGSGEIAANALDSFLVEAFPTTADQATIAISDDPEVVSKPRDQPEGAAIVRFSFASVAGDLLDADVIAGKAVVSLTGGDLAAEFAPTAGTVKGTFTGPATCLTGADTYDIEVSGSYELKRD